MKWWILCVIISFVLWIEECEFGCYGDGCNWNCGECKLGLCNIEIGECEGGCVVGWKGVLCKIGE